MHIRLCLNSVHPFPASPASPGGARNGAAKGVQLRIVIVDNASTDATVATLRDWAAGTSPYAPPDDLPFTLTPCAKPVILQQANASPLPDALLQDRAGCIQSVSYPAALKKCKRPVNLPTSLSASTSSRA